MRASSVLEIADQSQVTPPVDGTFGAAPLRVLFVQHCSERTGSTISGLLAAEGFRCAGWEVDVAFGFDGPMMGEYARQGCRTHVLPHKNWLRGGNLVRSARRIAAEWRASRNFANLINLVRPDVVYVNSLVSLAAAVAAHRLRIPCVWHLRELFCDVGGEMLVPSCGGRPLVRRLLHKLATRRVAISRAVAENILGTVDPGKVEIVSNAVGAEFFGLAESSYECRAQLGLPAAVPVVGVPGTLRPMKGHPFFLEAAVKVAREVPSCVFAITGTGKPDYEALLRTHTESLGLSGRVRFLGTVANMPQFYRACDAVCVPSVAEPFGRTVIEAFAVGTPVVGSAVGGIRETIVNGKTGLLASYGDVRSLQDALLRMLTDRPCALAIASAARQAACERYTAERYQGSIRSITAGVVTASRSRRNEVANGRDCRASTKGVVAGESRA